MDNVGDLVTENTNEGIDTVNSSITYTLTANVENLNLTGTADNNATGNALNNILTGNSGNNILDGALGADSLAGGLGNDTYVVDNVGDLVTENVNEGTDTVNSSISYALTANVENLNLTGTADLNGTGNALNNIINGNTGNNVIDGGIGADTMSGGLGNDTYVVDNAGDLVIEGANAGTDNVLSSISYSLTSNVENLTLTGSADLNGTGNELSNMITGNAGNNVLDGGLGADSMAGGLGNDTYIVDNIGDMVTENANEGTDTVNSSITYALTANVENLNLTGTTDLNATGNALNNIINGNSGNNLIDGGLGADTMAGGLGNDTYIVDNIGDLVIENTNEGIDTVQSSISYALTANVENLILTGPIAINGTGNNLNNVITGNNADNVLDGGAGADTMIGGLGNDTYIVDNVGDLVAENLNEGTDTVNSSISYSLTANVENLNLTGTTDLNATGNALNNIINGNSGNNLIDGGAGADTMAGGLGNDTYIVDNIGDLVTENANEGNDTVNSSISYTLTANVENLNLTGAADNSATGNALNNTIIGNTGNNLIDGGLGADAMSGGLGNDTYIVDNVGDLVTENVNEGTDTVNSSISYALTANVENLNLTGTADLNGTGNALNNIINGNTGNNVIDGGIGADTMSGGLGNDTYVVDNAGDLVIEGANAGTDNVLSSISYSLTSNVENLTLTGSADLNGTGNELSNMITGNAGNNVLDGGLGADSMAGGLGNDTYIVDNIGDMVTENANEGTDTVNSSITYALTANVENLNLTGTTDLNATGNALNNIINGNSGNNLIDGGLGADTMAGGLGNDTYIVDNIGDLVIENTNEGIDTVQSSISYALTANVENLILTGPIAINGTGNNLNNVITGNNADNVLDGGAGADTMIGGLGNDTYIVDNVGDLVAENLNEGTDTVNSSITYALTANVENLNLTGSADINATGNVLNNIINGNNGNNLIDGGAGADIMAGSLGNDTYIVDNVGDNVIENLNEGTDTVNSSIAYSLTANVENLNLTGSTDINATGNALNNIINGNSGNNILDGGLGADTMAGGLGNDTYIVDNIGDIVTENLNAGTDTINSSVSYGLSANVENMNLTGTGDINATGNVLNNVLTGNSGNNILDGGLGADTMVGGLGNDTYVVDNVGDVVTENLNAGIDLVQSNITYVLGANLENLTLTGTSAINGTGNALDNVILGNSANNTLSGGAGNDTLDGGAGADTMLGGTGNDTYVVDNVGDMVTENLNEGIDLVNSSITYALTNNAENLTLTGSAAINGTGNALDNVIIGNSANNTLSGGAGNDTLDGGLGADTMIGGTGNDTFIVDNIGDVVTENLNEGIDLVNSSITYTLTNNVENLTLIGSAAINGTGNSLDNVMIGNSANNTLSGGAGNDTLDGGAGADTMLGGTGNDTYVVDNVGDMVTENLNEGIDLVNSSITYALTNNAENLTLTGSAAINGTGNALDNVIIGNSANNTLSGGAGNDTLDGGLGADTMMGGTGNDTFIVDNIGDVVIENANEGIDLVNSAITYTLTNNVENLTLTGTAAISGTGNKLNNYIIGNAANNILSGGNDGNDTLDGGLGADTMSGGIDNDTYFVDNIGDVVIENANEGIDSVFSSINYTLANNVENLTLTGIANLNGTGNSLNNIITGNSGNNVIDGGLGADLMAGGAGNDTYVVDNVLDLVAENANEGFDTVSSSVNYYLSANVEELILAGSAAISGIDNNLNNLLIGNAAANGLFGGLGNDIQQGKAGDDALIDIAGNNVMDGGSGNDTLVATFGNALFIGGTGNDTIATCSGYHVIAFNTGDGQDTVNAAIGSSNTVSLGGSIDYANLALSKSGNNLILKTGGTDQITFKDWYVGTAFHSVVNLQVIAESMAGFNPLGSNVLKDKKVENFDFTKLVAAFDTARTATPSLTSWSMTNSLLAFHLGAGSDTAAIGGDLAYQYGKNGTITGMGFNAAQSVIGAANFAQSAQTLNNPTVWQAELVKLG